MSVEDIRHEISHIHVDLSERSIALESDGGVVARLTFADSRLLLHGLADRDDAEAPIASGQSREEREREAAVTVAGRLRSVPRDGKPDRNGRPTVWAPFLAFPAEEGRDALHYTATFYGTTVPIAMGLTKGANVTVRGFIRESDDPERDDWLSVVGFVNYPGKTELARDEPSADDKPFSSSPSPDDGAPASS